MSTASAPDGRHRESSPLHALPALDPERAGGIGLPGTPRSAPAARAHDADATVDAIAPHEGGGRPDERDADLADWAAESPSPALRRGHMAGTDIDEAVARYGALFPGTEFRAAKGPGDFSYRYSFVGDENVTLRSSVFPAEHWGRLPVLPDYVVAWWREGSGAVDVGSHEVRSSGTRPFLLPSFRSFSFRSEPAVQNLVHIDANFLEETAAELHEGRSRPLVFDHTRPPSPEQTTAWRHAVGEASPVLQDATSSPLLRMQAGLLVARATLELFPWHDVPFSAEMRAPRMSAVRAAIEYLHHHAAGPSRRRTRPGPRGSTRACSSSPCGATRTRPRARCSAGSGSTACTPSYATRRPPRPPCGRSPSSGASATSAGSPRPTRSASASCRARRCAAEGRQAVSAPAPGRVRQTKR